MDRDFLFFSWQGWQRREEPLLLSHPQSPPQSLKVHLWWGAIYRGNWEANDALLSGLLEALLQTRHPGQGSKEVETPEKVYLFLGAPLCCQLTKGAWGFIGTDKKFHQDSLRHRKVLQKHSVEKFNKLLSPALGGWKTIFFSGEQVL